MEEAARRESADVVVVGAGMIGAAAARHLAASGASVTVVAAPEPADWTAGVGPFASHYDAGRITRIVANSPFWSAAAAASTKRYSEIETRSGIAFHEPCGLAWVATDMEASLRIGRSNGANVEEIDVAELRSRTGIAAPGVDNIRCAFEAAPAGLVRPREHVAAELAVAQLDGAFVVHAAAHAVDRRGGEFVVSGAFGEVRGRRLLLATGAYGAALMGIELEMVRKLRTIVRAEIGPGPNIPSAIVHDVEHAALDGIYWVPPIRFPDGRTMIKIGGDYNPVRIAESTAEIDAWFTTDGCPDEAAALRETLQALLPEETVQSSDTRPCVVTTTPNELPYIGWIDDDVCVAVAGNGAAAKSCDELGRLAGKFVTDGWATEPLDPTDFAPRLAN